MAGDTGWLSPSATGGKYNDFTNPSNAYSSNDVYATRVTSTVDNYYQSFENFNITIPDGATIEGLNISIEGNVGGATLRLYGGFWNNGSSSWTDFADYVQLPDTTDSTQTMFGTDPYFKGGKTWIASDFTNANFSIAVKTDISATSRTYNLDHIQVKIYYSLDITMAAGAGAFTLTGIAAGLLRPIRNMAVSVGEFTLTGVAATFSVGHTIVAALGQFILTGISAIFTREGWDNISKNEDVTPTNAAKHTSSMTNSTKHNSTFTNKAHTPRT